MDETVQSHVRDGLEDLVTGDTGVDTKLGAAATGRRGRVLVHILLDHVSLEHPIQSTQVNLQEMKNKHA